MAGRNLGEAFVVISPDASEFLSELTAKVTAAVKAVKTPDVKVKVSVDSSSLTGDLAKLMAGVKPLYEMLGRLRVDADTTAASAKIAKLQAQVLALAKQMQASAKDLDLSKLAGFEASLLGIVATAEKLRDALYETGPALGPVTAGLDNLQGRAARLITLLSSIHVEGDDAALAAKIQVLLVQAMALRDTLGDVSIGGNPAEIAAKTAAVLGLEAAFQKVGEALRAPALAGPALGPVTRQLADLQVRARNVAQQLATVRIDGTDTGMQVKLDHLQVEAMKLRSTLGDVSVGGSPAKMLAANAAVLGLESALAKMTATGKTALPVMAGLWQAGATGWGWWGALTGRITLFGGALNKVLPAMLTHITLWHLTADVILETLAVIIPAGIALTAFGIAGSDAAKEIYNRMNAVHTVMDATGKAVPPMTNAMEKLHDAVRPQVYQLFGDALIIMNARSGEFATIAKATGTVVDQLAARFTYAMTNGKGMSEMMKHAVTDVQQLGTLIGNLGDIFASVFRALPGYANILLGIGVTFTGFVAAVFRASEPLLKFGLYLHGAFLYAGLAVTALVILSRAITTFAIGTLLPAIGAVVAFGAELLITARDAGVAAAAMLLIEEVNPVFWFAAAATAIAGLVFWLRSSHTAAQDFAGGLQDMVKKAQLAQLIPTIMNAQAAATGRLRAAQNELAHTGEYMNTINMRTGEITGRMVSPAYRMAQANVDSYRGALRQLDAQQSLVSGRVGALAKQYGSNTAALGALNAAGITTGQILDKNSEHWAQALIQVNATTQAYQAMGIQGGVLGNDLDVLGRTVTDQYTAIQKLNGAWSSFISDVTGTQTSFDTVGNGINNLNDAFSKAGGNAQTIKNHLGQLTLTGKLTGATMDGLSQASLDLNNAFSTQVQNTSKLYESWRTAGISNSEFTDGVKNSIVPLLRYAGGSEEATAQLVALAEQAGYQGPNSIKELMKWIGTNNSGVTGALQRMKNVTNDATTQEALLTGAMQSQGNYIATTLLNDISNAIIKYGGVKDAAEKYGQAIAQDGRESDQAKAARDVLINDLIKSGKAAQDSTGQIAAMITKVTGIPPKQAIEIVMTGNGSYTIKGPYAPQTSLQFGANAPGKHGGAQHGLRLPGWGGGDRIPIMAEAGETILPKQATADPLTRLVAAKYGVPGFQHEGLGGFAGGVFGLSASVHDLAGPPFGYGMLRGYQHGGTIGGGMTLAGATDVLTGDAAVSMVNDFKTRFASDTAKTIQQALHDAETSYLGPTANAILSYAESFVGKVPYVWGGQTPSGWDCSGFVSYVLEHVGLLSGRMVASGLQAWATPSPAAPGAMAFYGSPAHHVGFVVDGNTLLSALGRAYGTTYSSLNLGDNSGYGIPPSVRAATGGPAAAGGAGGSIGYWQSVGREMAAQYGWTGASEFDALNLLWMKESGWNPAARNPSSGAAGIPQDITGNFHGGGVGQIAWGLAYIASRYGDPLRAWAHEVALNWYKHGGIAGFDQGGALPPGLSLAYNGTGAAETVLPVPPEAVLGYATGGTVTAYRGQLGSKQAAELKDYADFLAGARAALAHPKPGSYEATHHKSILGELATLAKRQTAEADAYRHLAGAGLTLKDLGHLIAAVNAEIRVTHDVALGHLPGRNLLVLRSALAGLSNLSAHPPSLLSTLGPGAETLYPGWPLPSGQIDLPTFWLWLPRLQHDEQNFYAHVATGFRQSMAKDKPGSWAFTHRAVMARELQTLALRQNEEISAYNALMLYRNRQPPKSSATHLSSVAKSMAVTLQDIDLNHIPGGHPALLASVYHLLGQIYDLTGKQIGVPERPFPVEATGALPKRGTQAYATLASIFGWYDRGGILPPGLTLAYNGTGRNEVVSPVGPSGTYGPGGLTPGEMQLVNRLDRLIQLMGSAPAAYAQTLNGVAGSAANRGFYGGTR